MKITVLDGYGLNPGDLSWEPIAQLGELTVFPRTSAEEFYAHAEGADILLTNKTLITAEHIDRLPDLKYIGILATGYNVVDTEAARKHGIPVCNIPAYSSKRVAHTAVMMILNLSSSMQLQMKMLARGCHDNFTKNLQVGHVEVNDKVLGIIGAGNIGREVIKIAQAMDMKILAHTRTFREDADGVHYVDLPTLLRESDYVSLHCPLTPETRHLINRETLSMMKPTAFLINTSRGALVDEPALIEALKTGVIAGAGLDVQETEPPLPENPLYTMDNVILTPHMGWKGLETRKRLVSILAGNIEAYFQGMPVNVVS